MQNEKATPKIGAKVKEIGWAYPTSDDAKKFGYAARGCWTLSVGVWPEPLKAVAGCAEGVSPLIAQGETLESVWTPYSMV